MQTAGGAHPKWECKKAIVGIDLAQKPDVTAYSIVDEGKIAAVKIAQRGEKFDRVAWQKNYIREYMRKKRAKDKDKLK